LLFRDKGLDTLTAPAREGPKQSDLIEQIGDGVLIVIAFAALRTTLSEVCSIGFHLIDLAMAPEPLATAQQAYRAADPRWNVSALIVSLPIFLIAFWKLAARLDANAAIHRSKFFLIVLALLFLDTARVAATTIPSFLFGVISGFPIAPALFKIAIVVMIYGFFLVYLLDELRKAGAR
jgi:hypothetical protein